jgi:hypothetical protein
MTTAPVVDMEVLAAKAAFLAGTSDPRRGVEGWFAAWQRWRIADARGEGALTDVRFGDVLDAVLAARAGGGTFVLPLPTAKPAVKR